MNINDYDNKLHDNENLMFLDILSSLMKTTTCIIKLHHDASVTAIIDSFAYLWNEFLNMNGLGFGHTVNDVLIMLIILLAIVITTAVATK